MANDNNNTNGNLGANSGNTVTSAGEVSASTAVDTGGSSGSPPPTPPLTGGAANAAASGNAAALGNAAASGTARAHGFRESYLMLKPRYDLIPANTLPPATLDVVKVTVMGLSVLPEAAKLQPDIARELPLVPHDLVDQVKHALFGLAHANTLKQVAAAGEQGETVSDAAAPLRALNETILADVAPLVARGVVPAEAVVRSQGNNPRNVAFDTLRLVEVAESNYRHLEGQTKLTRADLQSAVQAAQDLLEFLATKEQAVESLEEATLTRLRAFAYFLALYEELRWAVRYVRRHQKDAHLIMPSLFTLRKKRSSGTSAVDDGDDEVQEQQTPPPAMTDDGSVDLEHLQALMNGGGQPAVNAPVTPGTMPNAAPKAPSGAGNQGSNGAR